MCYSLTYCWCDDERLPLDETDREEPREGDLSSLRRRGAGCSKCARSSPASSSSTRRRREPGRNVFGIHSECIQLGVGLLTVSPDLFSKSSLNGCIPVGMCHPILCLQFVTIDIQLIELCRAIHCQDVNRFGMHSECIRARSLLYGAK
jgi:hypothetical protein